jgi:phosphate transport system substrate-binding protein
MIARSLVAFGLVLTLGMAGACQPSGQTGNSANVIGVGATFPALLYARWAKDYHGQSAIQINYQGMGSGAGIKQITAKTVDFGASDKPLTPDELDKAGLYQFPTVMGGVAPIVNIPGVGPGQLKLTGEVLADIFLGTITRWNDPKVAALNPGLKLPSDKITVVHRADGSGTTFLFSSYLSLESPAWKSQVGADDALKWPTGLGGKGNDGVAIFVKQSPNSIGYVEYSYAKQNNLAYIQLQNHDGAFLSPTAEAFSAAAAGADWTKAPGNYLLLLDQPGPTSWPITGATFILVYKQPPNAEKTKATLAFFDWAYKNGDADASSLDYIPLPQSVKDLVRQQWAATIKDQGGQPLYAAAGS